MKIRAYCNRDEARQVIPGTFVTPLEQDFEIRTTSELRAFLADETIVVVGREAESAAVQAEEAAKRESAAPGSDLIDDLPPGLTLPSAADVEAAAKAPKAKKKAATAPTAPADE